MLTECFVTGTIFAHGFQLKKPEPANRFGFFVAFISAVDVSP